MCPSRPSAQPCRASEYCIPELPASHGRHKLAQLSGTSQAVSKAVWCRVQSRVQGGAQQSAPMGHGLPVQLYTLLISSLQAADASLHRPP